jgi:hypothetical protein
MNGVIEGRKDVGYDHRVHRVATVAYWRTFHHDIMRVKLAQAGEGGGCALTPCTTFIITSKVAVYVSAEWADTLTLFHL